MKVLHVVPTYLPAHRYGGPIHSVHGLCKALARRGIEVHVFTTNVDGNTDSDVPLERPVLLDGVKVWYFRSQYLRRLYYSQALGAALRGSIQTFNIVHLHSVFLWPTMIAARIAVAANVPFIISPRGMLVADLIRRKNHGLKRAWITLFERGNLCAAAALHFTSALEQREYEALKLPTRPSFVVPNGVDVTQAATEPAAESGLPMVLFLGRVNWKKGLDRLIPAMAYVPGAKLVIAGNDEEDYTPQLRRLAVAHDVSERVEFIGPVDGTAKRRLFAQAQLVALPSYSENFGNVVLEAWAAGCAVAVTPEVGLADTVKQAGAGVVAPGDPPALGRAIRSLLDNAERRKACAAAGLQLVQSTFSWPSVAATMEGQYGEILSRPQAVS